MARTPITSDNKKDILRFEMMALLHDFGKLSRQFLEYRRGWRKDANGWKNDPHLNMVKNSEYVTGSTREFPVSEDLFNIFQQIPDTVPSAECLKLTVEKILKYHENVRGCSIVKKANKLQMINAADGIDSAYDRNNPLFGSEQTDANPLRRSTAYGYESEVDLAVVEKAKEELSKVLSLNLDPFFIDPQSEIRRKLLDSIKAAFKEGLADTTRPDNDTTLWDHSYSVASIAKAIYCESCSGGETRTEFGKVDFSILGFAWDGTSFIAGAHKIADVGARSDAIDNLKKNLKNWVEYEESAGNCVYEDLDGIYFLIPRNYGADPNFKTDCVNKSVEKSQLASDGELAPVVHIVQETGGDLTKITECIKELRKKTRGIPFIGIPANVNVNIPASGDTDKSVCPLCGLRKILSGKIGVCSKCMERRHDNAKKALLHKGETAFMEEIERGNKSSLNRLALVMLNYDLDHWLDGTMFRTMFVSPLRAMDREIRQLGNYDCQKAEEKARRDKLSSYGQNVSHPDIHYDTVVGDLAKIGSVDNYSDLSHLRAFLYGRRFTNDLPASSTWGILPADVRDDPAKLAWQLLTKTPTPSSILDSWITTENFNAWVTDKKNILEDCIPKLERYTFEVHQISGEHKNIVLKASVIKTEQIEQKGKSFKFVVFGNTAYVLDDFNPQNATIEYWPEGEQVEKNEHKPRIHVGQVNKMPFRPMRTIAATPNLGYILMPARSVPEYIKFVQREYQKHFGKVVGRLPLFMGAVFFNSHTPMHIVFDAARRMKPNPGISLNKWYRARVKTVENEILKLQISPADGGQDIDLPIRRKLGDCNEDWHHPYMVLDGGGSDRKSYFETSGDMRICAFEDIEGLDIRFSPNLVDFEYLDNTARRYEIYPKRAGGRHSGPLKFSGRPYLAPVFIEGILHIGEKLSTMDGAQIHNLEEFLHEKILEWSSEGGSDWKKAIKKLAVPTIARFAPEFMNEDPGVLLEAIDLYLHILKLGSR